MLIWCHCTHIFLNMVPTISLGHICTEIVEVLGNTNSYLDFAKSGYDFVCHRKSEWDLPQSDGPGANLMITIYILMTKVKWRF